MLTIMLYNLLYFLYDLKTDFSLALCHVASLPLPYNSVRIYARRDS